MNEWISCTLAIMNLKSKKRCVWQANELKFTNVNLIFGIFSSQHLWQCCNESCHPRGRVRARRFKPGFVIWAHGPVMGRKCDINPSRAARSSGAPVEGMPGRKAPATDQLSPAIQWWAQVHPRGYLWQYITEQCIAYLLYTAVGMDSFADVPYDSTFEYFLLRCGPMGGWLSSDYAISSSASFLPWVDVMYDLIMTTLQL